VLTLSSSPTAGDKKTCWPFTLIKRKVLLLFTVADDKMSIKANNGADKQYLKRAICAIYFLGA